MQAFSLDSSIPRFSRLFSPSFLLFLVLTLAACDTADPGDFEEDLVVEGYLVAAEPLPQVRLSRTAPINTTYDFTALAVSGADVRIDLLDEAGGVEESYAYREDRHQPGVYAPQVLFQGNPVPQIRPLRRYRLEALVPESGRRIVAETVVPDTFRVVGANAQEVVYQSSEQLEITVSRSRSPGREANYYIFVTESLDPREEQLTPFAAALFEQAEGEITIEDLRVSGSPVFSEANYDLNPDGTLTIRFPWLAVTFYGPNRLFANALDDNLFDYVRSQSVQQGGSTFSPGEIPNPIEHVDGARGIFGSYARAIYEVTIRRSSDEDCAVIGGERVCGEEAP